MLEGVAKVHVDGVDHVLQSNDCVYIQQGAVHCLANETKLPRTWLKFNRAAI